MDNKTKVMLALLLVVGIAGLVIIYNLNDSVDERSNVRPSTIEREVEKEEVVQYDDDLPIPQLIEDDYTFIAQNGGVDWFEGVRTVTRGYNGNILGPTLKFTRGKDYNVTIKNEMEEETTVHWHGLLVDGDVDGVFQVIDPGYGLTQKLEIDQEASTAWYHPHPMHKTASQVMEGLAGMIIIEDDNSMSLGLPSEYGVNDIPLVFQRKAIDDRGQIVLDEYRNFQIVNGADNPTLRVKNEWIRLRIVNGNNDEITDYSFSKDLETYIIATDNGLTSTPLRTEQLFLAPGERVELLVNLTELNVGEKFTINTNDTEAMKVEIKGEVDSNYSFKLPTSLSTIPEIGDISDLKVRQFELDSSGMSMSINGEPYDIDKVNEYIELGTQEVWEVSVGDLGMHSTSHPFHVHGVTFQIISRDGERYEDWEQGMKDTVLVSSEEKVRILATFNNKGKYVYHCHFLNHEERGMMGTFVVQ